MKPLLNSASEVIINKRTQAELLRVIPRDAKAIAGVGECADLAEKYRLLNPFCEYGAGIEGRAANSLDAIVCINGLEYADSLQDSLRNILACLKDDGVLIALIPNGSYWYDIAAMFSGVDIDFSGRPQHRFSINNFNKLIQKCGFKLVDAVPLMVRNEDELPIKRESFQNNLPKIAGVVGYNENKLRSETAASHYIVRCVKQQYNYERVLIHSLMLRPQAACNDLRIIEPLHFISSISGVNCIFDVKALNPRMKEAFQNRIFIYQRPIMRYSDLRIPRWAVQNGYLMIMEFDDHPMRWPEIAENNYLNYRGVHAVQTSTPELADFFQQFNPNVRVFPNQLAELPPHKPDRRDYPVTVFFGALNRQDDWAEYMPTINKVIANLGDAIHFKVVFDEPFFNALQTSNKEFTGLCEYDAYRRILYGCDISFMPLADNVFNRMKSDLKFIEACGHRAVALATPVVYNNSIRDGETGVLFTNPAELEERLTSLVTNHDLRNKISSNAYNYVKAERLQVHHYKNRYAWYQQLLADKPRLDAELKARVPELWD